MVYTRQKHKQERKKNNGDYAGDHCIEIYFENRMNVSICHKFMRCSWLLFFSLSSVHLFTFQVYVLQKEIQKSCAIQFLFLFFRFVSCARIKKSLKRLSFIRNYWHTLYTKKNCIIRFAWTTDTHIYYVTLCWLHRQSAI